MKAWKISQSDYDDLFSKRYESADGGSARPSDESARQNRAPTEYANGRPSSRPDSTTCNSSFFAVRQ
jgi:hypothetical protein